MDRDLLRQCLVYHGESLFSKLKCEQTENPDFQAVVSDLCKAPNERKVTEKGSSLVEQFIARKADILFSPAWRTATPQEQDHEEEEAAEPYATMPPLELFMELSYEERRSMIYRDLEKGDIVVGRINNIREYGFFLTLTCMAGGLKRDIVDLELSALCHVREIPSSGSHDDPLAYYQIGDFIRAGVKDIDRYQEKITVSLHQGSLCPALKHIKLGVITQEEMPIHYSRGVRAAADSRETYECILRGCHGYQNPSVVEYLLEKVGISDRHPPSMMRGLQSKHFQEEDFASAIRKKQSASWALKCVRAGVDHFKHGRHVEAMNEYNKALEIDTNNVEALVARGALYANKGSILKAISDFELALENCPDHRNAKKYLCQTLVERGKQLEEQEKLVTAEGVYRRALSLDDSNPEAKEALHNISDLIQKSIRLREEALAKEQVKPKSGQTSADKLRKILKEEKRMKKKKKRTTSSSPSLSSSRSSSSRSSSSRKRSKKKKKKRRKSDRGSKRHRRISSRESRKSEEGKSEKDRKEKEDEEVEWYPEPPNTSATFLNQTGGLLFEGEDEVAGRDREARRRGGLLNSVSAASEEDDSDSSRRDTKRMDGAERRTRTDEQRRSPQKDQGRGRSSERRKLSIERGRDDDRKDRGDGESKRRSSFEENQTRRSSCSSVEVEHSRKSSFLSEYSGNSGSASKHLERRMSHDSSSKNSFDGGRYENRGKKEEELVKIEKEAGKERSEDEGHASGRGKINAGNQNGQSGTGPKKELPANLLEIFNQIAQFEKEKGSQAKVTVPK